MVRVWRTLVGAFTFLITISSSELSGRGLLVREERTLVTLTFLFTISSSELSSLIICARVRFLVAFLTGTISSDSSSSSSDTLLLDPSSEKSSLDSIIFLDFFNLLGTGFFDFADYFFYGIIFTGESSTTIFYFLRGRINSLSDDSGSG